MRHPPRNTAAPERRYGAIRSTLITVGVAVFTIVLWRGGIGAASPAATGGSAAGYVLAGLAVQVLLFAAHAIVRRLAPDTEAAEQGRLVVELIGDGVTVLLFAVGVLGAVRSAVSGV